MKQAFSLITLVGMICFVLSMFSACAAKKPLTTPKEQAERVRAADLRQQYSKIKNWIPEYEKNYEIGAFYLSKGKGQDYFRTHLGWHLCGGIQAGELSDPNSLLDKFRENAMKAQQSLQDKTGRRPYGEYLYMKVRRIKNVNNQWGEQLYVVLEVRHFDQDKDKAILNFPENKMVHSFLSCRDGS